MASGFFATPGTAWKNVPWSTKVFAKSTNPRRRTQPSATLGSKLLGGVHPEGKSKSSTTHPKKFKSCSQPRTPCQVSSNLELTRVVRQFREANRAPSEVEKEFWLFLMWVLEFGWLLRPVSRKRIKRCWYSITCTNPDNASAGGSGSGFALHGCNNLGPQRFLHTFLLEFWLFFRDSNWCGLSPYSSLGGSGFGVATLTEFLV